MRRLLILCTLLLTGCDHPLAPTEAPEEDYNQKDEDAQAHSLHIWLDFEGVELDRVSSFSCEDLDHSSIDRVGYDIPSHVSTDMWRLLVEFSIRNRFVDYDVTISQQRELDGRDAEQTIRVIFAQEDAVDKRENETRPAGVAHVDCGNDGLEGLAFVFRDQEEDNVGITANIALHEIGHSLGLPHLSALKNHIMYDSSTSRADSVFVDACIHKESTTCDDEDRVWRCAPGQWNPHRELLGRIGPK